MGVRKYNIYNKREKDIPRPAPLTVREGLIMGESYWIGKKKLKLVGKYTHFARFEDNYGFITCFSYPELQEELGKVV